MGEGKNVAPGRHVGSQVEARSVARGWGGRTGEHGTRVAAGRHLLSLLVRARRPPRGRRAGDQHPEARGRSCSGDSRAPSPAPEGRGSPALSARSCSHRNPEGPRPLTLPSLAGGYVRPRWLPDSARLVLDPSWWHFDRGAAQHGDPSAFLSPLFPEVCSPPLESAAADGAGPRSARGALLRQPGDGSGSTYLTSPD